MLRNLRAEMAREGITIKDLSVYLGVRYATVCDKINGRNKFYLEEAFKIRKKFFPSCTVEYLFEHENHHNTA